MKNIIHSDILKCVLIISLPNLIFYILAYWVFFERPLFLLEYFVVIPFFLLVYRKSVRVWMPIIVIADVVFTGVMNYYPNFFSGISVAGDITHHVYFYKILFATGVIIYVSYLGGRNVQNSTTLNRKSFLIIMFFAALLTVVVDTLNSKNVIQKLFLTDEKSFVNPYSISSRNVAGSLFYSIYKHYIEYGESLEDTSNLPIQSFVHDFVLENKSELLGKNIVVVVLESFGYPESKILQSMIFKPLGNDYLNKNFNVDYGSKKVPLGSTVPAELRELCGVKASKFSDNIDVNLCVPNLLKEMSYETIGLHGYLASFFDRDNWWKSIGIDKGIFANDFSLKSQPLCPGSFRSFCDNKIFKDTFLKYLKNENSKKFLYFLSVNAHVPVYIDGITNKEDCEPYSKRGIGIPCYNVLVNASLIRQIIMLIEVEKMKDTIFLLIGDHVPRYPSIDAAKVYKDNVVSYIKITPKRLKFLHSSGQYNGF